MVLGGVLLLTQVMVLYVIPCYGESLCYGVILCYVVSLWCDANICYGVDPCYSFYACYAVNTCLPFCIMVWYYGDNPGYGISLCCGVSLSYHVSPVMV